MLPSQILITNKARKIEDDLCKKHADNATSVYSEEGNIANCFVGVSASSTSDYDITKVTRLALTSRKKGKYSARYHVDKVTGTVAFVEPYQENL